MFLNSSTFSCGRYFRWSVQNALIFILIALAGGRAQAGGLFFDTSCIPIAADERVMLFGGGSSGLMGLTCEQLRQYRDDIAIVSIALMPVNTALNSPGVKEVLLAELAKLGLAMANPPILAVTVFGVIGVSTVLLILKKEMKECEREEREKLKSEILRELQESLGIRNNGKVELQFQK